MANVSLSASDANAINSALQEADRFLAKLEQLATTARPIRRDDILAPAFRQTLNEALAVKLQVADAKAKK